MDTWSSCPLGNSETTIECTSQSYPIHRMKELGYLYNDPVGHQWKIASELLCKGTSVGQKKLQMLASGSQAWSPDMIRARGWGGH